MKGSNPARGKILQHADGLGVASPEMVRKRAEEIACIDGRTSEEVTVQDLRRASEELMGGHDFVNGPEAPESVFDERENDGRKITGFEESPESLGEELVAEGVDEAVHEQMLAASRRALEEEDQTEA